MDWRIAGPKSGVLYPNTNNRDHLLGQLTTLVEGTSTWLAGKPMVPVLTVRLSDANPWKVTGLVSVMPEFYTMKHWYEH